MLTVLDVLSVAGRREGQNDDCVGWGPHAAWVIDGATDVHGDAPLIPGAASDAAWFAQALNRAFYACAPDAADPQGWFVAVARQAGAAFRAGARKVPGPRWEWPVSASFAVFEDGADLVFVDVGDCAAFGLTPGGGGLDFSPEDTGKADEHAGAAAFATPATGEDRYRNPDAGDWLRADRAAHNTDGGYVAFGLEAERLRAARVWRQPKAELSHVLLMTDGFAALEQVYGMYSPAELVLACLDRGLAALAEDLRATEHAGAAKVDRWKRSDDASAILIRID